MIMDLFDLVWQIRHAARALNQIIRAYGYASPYTKQAAYSMICFIEERCKMAREILDRDMK